MREKKVSVVIPTLQKNKDLLHKLVESLEEDNSVSEIIVIDNSLQGLSFSTEKLKLITPEQNLFVNPSWNLGVKIAKNEIVALLNDDIIIPTNFCHDVISQMNPEMGIVGMNGDKIEAITDIDKQPVNENIYLEPASYMDHYYGVAMFFYKSSYNIIPNEIKIVYGDSWIFTFCKRQKKQNQRICGCTIFHFGSLTSGLESFNPIAKSDSKIYKKLTVKWYHRLFSYEELWDYNKFRILGMTLRFKKGKAGGKDGTKTKPSNSVCSLR